MPDEILDVTPGESTETPVDDTPGTGLDETPDETTTVEQDPTAEAILEQERASIIRYFLGKTGLTHYYTDKLPKTFAYPSVYFPTPEIASSYDTLSTYSMYYRMAVRFFAADNQTAYYYARIVANSLIAERNRIPMIAPDGTDTKTCFRVKKSDVKKIDTGVYGFNIEWESIRTFDDIPDTDIGEATQIDVSLQVKI